VPSSADYPDLAGKVVLVTGGTGGIGAPLCRALAAQGTRVGVVGRHRAAALGLARELGEPALAITADCTVPSQVEAMRDELVSKAGPPDAVVCLAGGAIIEAAPAHLVTPRQWEAVIAGNLTATFLTIRSMLPLMIERQRGTVVTVASAAARIPSAMTTAPYAAAKAGVIALTRQVARETAPDGIRVNCVSPSVIVTGTNAPAGERLEQLTHQHPLGRLGTPADVTSAVLFLLSSASGWITGVTLDVAGGRTADLPIEAGT
jgi:3-oxoacyl-[acyl-carrier protein] reductase